MPPATASRRIHTASELLERSLPHGRVLDESSAYADAEVRGVSLKLATTLTPVQRGALTDMLAANIDLFTTQAADLPGYTGDDGPFVLGVEGDAALFQRPRRHSARDQKHIDEYCTAMLESGCIRKMRADEAGYGKYACNLTVAAKKDADTGEWTDVRVCEDGRHVNQHTPLDPRAMPRADTLFDALGSDTWISSIDLAKGYHQITMAPDDEPKTAFWWRGELYCWRRMNFGWKNACAKFQRVMDVELAAAGVAGSAQAYLDDVLCHTPTFDAHVAALGAIFDRFRAVGLRMHPKKCRFAGHEVEFLGHMVCADGIQPHAAKVQGIADMPMPHDVSAVRAQLGMFSYYRHFIPNMSTVAAPLNELLKKDVPFVFGAAQREALLELRRLLCAPGIGLRRFRDGQPTVLHTDFSGVGIGAILGQHDADGSEYMVACASRSLNVHERRYPSFYGELLAGVWAMHLYRVYLDGLHFTWVTDHRPLQWLMDTREFKSAHHSRWALALSGFSFDVVHRPGALHVNADVASRHAAPTTADRTGARLDDAGDVAPVRVPPTVDTTGAPCPPPPPCPDGAPKRTRPRAAAAALSASSNHAAAVLAVFASPVLATGGAVAAAPMPEGNPRAADTDMALRQHSYAQWARAAWVKGGYEVHSRPSAAPVVPRAWYDAPLVVVELFGGLCPGVEAALRAGRRLVAVYYVDSSAAARGAAMHRLQQMAADAPDQLPLQALLPALSLGNVVQAVDAATWRRVLNAHDDASVLVCGGWECQDLSQAGRCKGADDGQRSRTMHPFLCTLDVMRRHAPTRVGYIAENVPFKQHGKNAAVLRAQYDNVASQLGDAVVFDACDVGSGAHRLRCYWTNLAPQPALDAILQQARREPWAIRPQSCMDEGTIVHADATDGLPTLVKTIGSYAFRGGRRGTMHDHQLGLRREPRWHERAKLMGIRPSDLGGRHAATGQLLSERQKHELIGNAIDSYALDALYGCAVLASNAPKCTPSASGTVLTLLPTWVGTTAPLVKRIAAAEPIAWGSPVAGGRSPGDTRGIGYRPAVCTATMDSHNAKNGMLDSHKAKSGMTMDPHEAKNGMFDFKSGMTMDPHEAKNGMFDSYNAKSNETLALTQTESSDDGDDERCAVVAACDAADYEPHRTALDEEWASELHRWAWPQARLDAGAADRAAAALAVSAARAADAAEDAVSAARPRDVYDDSAVLAHLQRPADAVDADVARRARGFEWHAESPPGRRLRRRVAQGVSLVVPPPSDRPGIIRRAHERTGHYGVLRTTHLVRQAYWWRNLSGDVRRAVAECPVCDRARAAVTKRQATLRPLAIRGLMYRWNVDLFGPLQESKWGNTYVLLAIEAFTKWVEAIPIPDKRPVSTRRAFLGGVLCRYGACGEVLTDQGGEFMAEFATMLEEAYIDHRTTSRDHPEADGLAERAVQTIKSALGRGCDAAGADWEDALPWVLLGYRCSVQAATGYSPYELLYTHAPVLPEAVRERFTRPVAIPWHRGAAEDADDGYDADAVATELLERALLARERATIAMGNQLIAQHRDTLRYARRRDATYEPRLHRYRVGDFVYVEARSSGSKDSTGFDALRPKVQRAILRVAELRDSGVAVLEDAVGARSTEHITHLAPCHLTHLVPPGTRALVCDRCHLGTNAEQLLQCTVCKSSRLHLWCCQPPLRRVPATWRCPACRAAKAEVRTPASGYVAPPTVAAQQREARHATYHGRRVQRRFRVGGRWTLGKGTIAFEPAEAPPFRFRCRYDDGDDELMDENEVLRFTVAEADPAAPGPVPRPSRAGSRRHRQFFNVERVLDHRRGAAGKPTELLVRWEGYTADDDSWVALDAFVGGREHPQLVEYAARAGVALAATGAPSCSLTKQPPLLAQMRALMPGFGAQDAERLAQHLPGGVQAANARLFARRDLAEAVPALRNVLRLASATTVVVAGDEWGVLRAATHDAADPYVTNGVVPLVYDVETARGPAEQGWAGRRAAAAVSPSAWQRVQRWLMPDVALLALPHAWADYALPLAAQHAVGVVAALVPRAYLTRAPVPRAQWLHAIAHSGFVPAPDAAGGTRMCWLLVANAEPAWTRLVDGVRPLPPFTDGSTANQ